MYKAPRGTADILPDDQPHWRLIEQKAAETCRLYGYERIDTPVFEDTGLFSRSIGEETDIVSKEMYTFEDRGGNQVTLRPEGTAPVCRAYLEHGLASRTKPVKLYYLSPIFRYERPQSGRYRQHHQFGYEAIGDGDAALDAEVIDMAWRFFASLKLTGLSLQLNSIGCRQDRPGYIKALKAYYADHLAQLCPDCNKRYQRNPLRLLDCKKPICTRIAAAAPKNTDYLCPECGEHFNRLTGYLRQLKLPFVLNHRLVRGLDYYTRTVFEIQPEGQEAAQSTLGGGGRYDNLIEQLGGQPTPAVGFATGLERIVLNIKKQEIAVPPLSRPAVFIAGVGAEAVAEAIKLAARLRENGTGVIQGSGGRSLKAQLRQANGLGAKYAVIIGEREVENGTVILRNMATSEQETVALNDLAARLE
jgi:histidyl-tRNA synthetase